MKKPAFCICEIKDTHQLGGNPAADQRLLFHYIDSSIPLLPKLLTIFCGHTAQFMSDLVVNPKDRFCCDMAHMTYQ